MVFIVLLKMVSLKSYDAKYKVYWEKLSSTWLKCPTCGPTESNLRYGSCVCGHKFQPHELAPFIGPYENIKLPTLSKAALKEANKTYEESNRRSTWLKCPTCGPSESNLRHGSCVCGHKFHPYELPKTQADWDNHANQSSKS